MLGGAEAENACDGATWSFSQSMGERGGLRNASFSLSFAAMTTARANRDDFRISTSLKTIESAWMWAGVASFSSANLVRLSSSRMFVEAV